mmetsp:Transcript_22964/g.33708  ORF Transcript_22964/g.33708 Transcript_22964/m.33708 type:complete len:428 (+) Transcript_22964:386-1669(+)
MTIRVPTKIIGRTVDYNKEDLTAEACDAMTLVQQEMLNNGAIRALSNGPNFLHWNKCLQKYLDDGATWNELPWYVAETYVYHRLLEASGYWDPSAKGFGHDIFAKEKAEALQQVLPQVAIRMDTCADAAGQWTTERFRSILHMALWGNQGDSSLFTVSEMSAKGTADTAENQNSRLLVDDTDFIFSHLDSSLDASRSEVHMFNDNSGMELVSDLALVHFLLSSGKVAKVVMHLKPYPFFVSDAIPSDIDHTLSILSASADANQRNVAGKLREFIKEGSLVLTTSGAINNFLASPEPMWCMAAEVRGQLTAPVNANVALVICKGDLMYRKLLGDRSWNADESFADILSYFPCPVVALRTCKSPLAVGMQPGQEGRVAAVSPQWMVNGEYGMVQFSMPPPGAAVKVSEDNFQVQYDAALLEQQWSTIVQ